MKYMEKACSVCTVDERLNHYGRLCNILRSLMILSLIKSLFHTGGHVNTHFDNSLKKSPSVTVALSQSNPWWRHMKNGETNEAYIAWKLLSSLKYTFHRQQRMVRFDIRITKANRTETTEPKSKTGIMATIPTRPKYSSPGKIINTTITAYYTACRLLNRLSQIGPNTDAAAGTTAQGARTCANVTNACEAGAHFNCGTYIAVYCAGAAYAIVQTSGAGKACVVIDISIGIRAGACSDAYADVRDAVEKELVLVLTLVQTYIFTFVATKLGLMLMLIFKLMPRLVLTRTPLLVALIFVLQQFPTSGLIHNS
uniref:Uncharacterized protein n=1 Tax=Glossina pallidipes TaxID=7398 RepID=A0A1A9ZJB5_GLOPL